MYNVYACLVPYIPQTIVTSSAWVHELVPPPISTVQADKVASSPWQPTLSNQMGPVPLPKVMEDVSTLPPSG